MDINLIGDPLAPVRILGDPEPVAVDDPKRRGFQASPQGRAILANIEAYYNNVVQWLSPPSLMHRHWVGGAILALQSRICARSRRTHRQACSSLGQLAVATLGQQVRPGMLIAQMVAALPDPVRLALPALPWGPVTGTRNAAASTLTFYCMPLSARLSSPPPNSPKVAAV